MNAEAVMNSIVEEVLRRLQARMKKALVVFTGGSIGFQDALLQLKRLQEEEWDFKVLLSNSAEYVLTPQVIKEKLSLDNVYLEREVKGLQSFYRGANLLMFPTLTLNTAVKLAVGIADTLATNIAGHMLMEGIPIIAAKDACDLHHPTRLKLGMDKTPKAYLDKMDQHLLVLESYGIQLVEAKDLYQAAQSTCIFSQEKKQGYPEPDQPHQETTFPKKVLSRLDVIEAKRLGQILRLPETSIVTPLALEAAKEFGVTIIQDSKGR